MKFRVLAILGGVLLTSMLSAQTLTDVINEFNMGVEKLNSQEYEVSIEHFNQVIALAEQVGDEGNDMKSQAENMIPSAYYRQATVFMKRKQYDNAIPYLENTVETATLYKNNEETSAKASKYLPQLYVREGNREWKNKSYDAALAYFDKALGLKETLYQAYQGKGMVYLDMDETDMMLESFAKAKAGAEAKGDTKTINKVNGVIDKYYNKFITDEMENVDPEENDYSYVVEACENALASNPNNPRALYHLALVSNKNSQYDSAISYAQKAVQNEKDPVWASAANYEMGLAYDKSSKYDKACEAYRLVTEDPFLAKAEKKMVDICN